MHDNVLAYVSANLPPNVGDVLEFGARDINGTVRSVIPATGRYVGVDLYEGQGVDVVGDASSVTVPGEFDLVVCTEVFEHAPDEQCQAMCDNAYRHLRPGGRLVATMAGPGRHEHSALGSGGSLKPGEFYRNVDEALLANWLRTAGFVDVTVDRFELDMRCTAVKGDD